MLIDRGAPLARQSTISRPTTAFPTQLLSLCCPS